MARYVSWTVWKIEMMTLSRAVVVVVDFETETERQRMEIEHCLSRNRCLGPC